MSSTSASTDPAVDAAPAEEIVLANCAYLLARACSSPQQVLDEEPMQLRSAIQGADPALAQVGHELTACWTAARAEPLIQVHARLFVGPFSILVSPYASFYLERDQRLMGEVSQAVAQA